MYEIDASRPGLERFDELLRRLDQREQESTVLTDPARPIGRRFASRPSLLTAPRDRRVGHEIRPPFLFSYHNPPDDIADRFLKPDSGGQ